MAGWSGVKGKRRGSGSEEKVMCLWVVVHI